MHTFVDLMESYEEYLWVLVCPYCGGEIAHKGAGCCGEVHECSRGESHGCPTFQEFCKWEF
jgi:hypothetical protein